MNFEDYARLQICVKKLLNLGWGPTAIGQLFGLTKKQVYEVRDGHTFHPKVEDRIISALNRVEFLPDHITDERHYTSQLRALGHTYEGLAKLVGTSAHHLSGVKVRKVPKPEVIARLKQLGGDQLCHPDPYAERPCVYEGCLAAGAYDPVAEATFCPVHAANARRILHASKERIAA
ncbi:hypothetical protein ACEN2D_02365 [Corynebacterium auriscanis]|uniref:hypothetical protein n=1 Tax=Corynebacterium auriscanis TaxID=99807 RepID=UPI003CF64FF8